MNWTALIESTLILFAIVNPVGSVPLFLQLTHKMPPEDRKKAFGTAVWTALVILFVFILAGQGMLTYLFRITANDLQAAGGLLLLIIAIDHLVFGALAKSVMSEDGAGAHQIGAVPIACPILAGPGAMMTAFMNYMNHGFAVAALSIVIVMALTALVLSFIDTIYRTLGKVVCLVLSKIMCLFLAAIGIHLLMTGLQPYLQ
ncbi:MAG: MarC family protein [Candidatus Omnitrophota bacterium]|nr:MarC family protein [Candidatus Omnitrophota bacterium]MDZ4242538.1 MarC family protein [Candidatus Omnitrophota bacterium]